MRIRASALAAMALVLLSAGLLFAVLRGSCSTLFRDPTLVRQWASSWGMWAPAAIIILQAAQVLLAPIPGQVIGLASGYLFGVAWGTIYSLLGTALGSLCAFVLARTLGRPLVERLVPPQTLARLDHSARQRGLFFFVLAFLLPFLPDDVICFAAGLTPIPIPALMLAVLAGRPPGILVSTWVGAHAVELGPSQWAVLIGASVLLGVAFLLYGDELEHWTTRLIEGLSKGDTKLWKK